jgi:lipid II:glycine glycyltransferase (peptidoglycan interpeptide bridge formation enzyme)
MAPACRRCIRKADREGVRIEIAADMSFVDEYYEQLKHVFARQQLVPTYTKERVELLLHYLLPTGQLLLLRARDREGRCIATGIFPAHYDTMYFWGGASWRHDQHLRPNQAIQWFAIRYWKARNMMKYDMSGSGEYKRKYGGTAIAIPWGRKSRYRMLENFRAAAKSYATVKQHALGLAMHWRSGGNGNSSVLGRSVGL